MAAAASQGCNAETLAAKAVHTRRSVRVHDYADDRDAPRRCLTIDERVLPALERI